MPLLILALTWLAALGTTWALVSRGRLRTPWHLDVAALGLLFLAALGFFWRVASGQNWMPADGGDLVSFLFPTYRFAAATLQQGAWPLWNPHLYGGAPHVADIQAGFLYPPNLALFLLRPDFPYASLQWLSLAHIWWAGAGMYLFACRGLRLGRVPALAAAVAFMFSDAFLTHFGNLNLNAVASWLPWIFWAFLAGLGAGARPGRLAGALLAGLLLGIATLAGHIQMTLFIGLALAVYTLLWALLSEDRPGPRLAAGALALAATALIAFLIAAPVLLPALQLAGLSARAGWNYQAAAGYSLSPAQWIGWLVPGFFGRSPQLHWGVWPRVESGYVGILTLVLAVLAFALRRDRRTWSWVGLAVVALILAFGIYAIPHGWLTLLPGFGQLRAPARLVLVAGFAVAVLAAIGLDAALSPLEGQARTAFGRVTRYTGYATVAVFVFAVPLAYLAQLLVQGRDADVVMHASLALMGVMAFAGLLLASYLWLVARREHWASPRVLGPLAVLLIYLDLAGLGAYQDLGNDDPSASFAQPAIAAFLGSQPGAPFRIDTRTEIEEAWQPDTALLYGLEDVGGVANPLALADSVRYWESLGSRSSRLYDLLNARYLIARKDVTLDWEKFALAFDGDPDLNVYENRRALPRAFVAGDVRPVPDHEAAWAVIQAPGFDPEVTAVVEAQAPGGGSGAVAEVAPDGPNRLRVRASADGPVLLVISQPWYPGWQAIVDGVPQGPPLRADYAFQGVPLPAGEHTVELRFEPPAWRTGWLLALLGLILLAAGFAFAWKRWHHAAPGSPPGE